MTDLLPDIRRAEANLKAQRMSRPEKRNTSGVFRSRRSVGSSTVCVLRNWGRSMPGARLANSGGHYASSLEYRSLNSDVDRDGRRRRSRPGSGRRIVQQG
jgi:hypothetical protein